MFNADFWPTPPQVGQQMIEMLDLPAGVTVLEPSCGVGNLVIQLKAAGYNVIGCEKDERLKRVAEHECVIVADDFFTLTSSQISHIKAIVMNPPFFDAEKHIRHAWSIAPEGCKILSLCNHETVKNQYSRGREELGQMIEDYGRSINLGNCFGTAERKTEVEVALVYLQKPASNYESEFQGFFMEEEEEEQENGIMRYDAIRDIVNRYVSAVKLYDQQIVLGVQMMGLINLFPSYTDSKGNQTHLQYLTISQHEAESYRVTFKKELQKRAWKFIFDKMDLRSHSTRGLQEDLNKFVEEQVQIPFTMKNIYRMLEIVVGTTSSRMDRALLEVFDAITRHYDENRYCVEGWKTNSHYLVNQKFIFNHLCSVGWSGQIEFEYYRNGELVEDMAKALCYMTGKRYEDMYSLHDVIRLPAPHMHKPEWGKWFDWGFFEVRCYKKGTMHFKFKDVKIWEQFNSHIARIKGYPLFEGNSKRESYQGDFFKDKQEAA